MLRPLINALVNVLALASAIAGLVPLVSSQDEPKAAVRFEVCVLGTTHAPWQFRWAGNSPAHIRAALRKLKPDVIGVESNPEWFAKGVFHEVTYEAQGIAVPFAKKRGLPIYGIDWMDVPMWELATMERRRKRIARIRTATQSGALPTRMFGELSPTSIVRNGKTRQFFFKKDMSFAHINQVEDDEYAKQWLHGDLQAQDFGGQRNREIAKRCVEVMRKHPGKRLVVVIGAGHKAVLDTLFSKMPGVRVVRMGRNVAAPTAKEIVAAQTTEDLVVMLGHNLDGERSCFHAELIDLARMRTLIAKLLEVTGFAPQAHYFAARLALLTGDWDLSARELDAAATAVGKRRPAAPLYPFPMQHWRMVYNFEQAIRVTRAELAITKDDHVSAARHLKGIAEQIRLPDLPDDLWAKGELVTKVPAEAKHWSANGPVLRLIRNVKGLVAEQMTRPAVGMAALTHKVEVETTNLLRIGLSVRASNRTCGAIVVYERDSKTHAMRRLGSNQFTTGPRWEPVGAYFQVRDKTRPVWIFVYLDAALGTRFGVQDIEIRQAETVSIPPTWIPRRLAREYLRTVRRSK